MDLKTVVSHLEAFSPTSLAESWDNVGLLVEPSTARTIEKIFLTNDLTETVMEEAVKEGVGLIVSYHPPVFKPLKSLTQKNWKERVVVRCMEEKIAVFSPHTAWDNGPEGINPWLLEAYKPDKSDCKIDYSWNWDVKPAVYPLGFPYYYIVKGYSIATKYLQPLFAMSGISVSLAPSALTISYPHSEDKQQELWRAMPEGMLSCAQQYYHMLPFAGRDRLDIGEPAARPGRMLELKESLVMKDVVARTKEHLGINHVRVALANGSNLETMVASIGVCAGSGYSALANCKADVVVTGEMSHHEVLDFVHRGVSVILTEHSNCERGYLRVVRDRLKEDLGEAVTVILSSEDRDPLSVM